MSRREEVADAAIATLAAEGLRGLTHRAVDRRADLPEGSSSYYFRTRQALLEATVQRMADLDDTDLLPTDTPADAEAVAAMVGALIEYAVTRRRERMLARYELSMEAARRPELKAALRKAGERYRVLAAALLQAAGSTAPERQGRALVAFMDGLIYDRLAGAGARALTEAETRVSVREVVMGMLAVEGGRPTGS